MISVDNLCLVIKIKHNQKSKSFFKKKSKSPLENTLNIQKKTLFPNSCGLIIPSDPMRSYIVSVEWRFPWCQQFCLWWQKEGRQCWNLSLLLHGPQGPSTRTSADGGSQQATDRELTVKDPCALRSGHKHANRQERREKTKRRLEKEKTLEGTKIKPWGTERLGWFSESMVNILIYLK